MYVSVLGFKILGGICVVLAASGYGYSRGLEYKRHAEELEYLSRLIRQMAGEIRYTKAPLAEVCSRMKSRAREPYRGWLAELAHALEMRNSSGLAGLWTRGDGSLEELWRDAVRSSLAQLNLDGEERKELENLGSQMGCIDVRMQEETLLWYAGRLEECQKRLAGEAAEKQRLCNILGVTGGLFLVILLI